VRDCAANPDESSAVIDVIVERGWLAARGLSSSGSVMLLSMIEPSVPWRYAGCNDATWSR
jgi:hypothetical protein